MSRGVLGWHLARPHPVNNVLPGGESSSDVPKGTKPSQIQLGLRFFRTVAVQAMRLQERVHCLDKLTLKPMLQL